MLVTQQISGGRFEVAWAPEPVRKDMEVFWHDVPCHKPWCWAPASRRYDDQATGVHSLAANTATRRDPSTVSFNHALTTTHSPHLCQRWILALSGKQANDRSRVVRGHRRFSPPPGFSNPQRTLSPAPYSSGDDCFTGSTLKTIWNNMAGFQGIDNTFDVGGRDQPNTCSSSASMYRAVSDALRV